MAVVKTLLSSLNNSREKRVFFPYNPSASLQEPQFLQKNRRTTQAIFFPFRYYPKSTHSFWSLDSAYFSVLTTIAH